MTTHETSPAVVEPSMTIDEFCLAERISRATFFKLLREGNAPEIMTLPGTRVRRITHCKRLEWHQRNAAQTDAKAAKRRVDSAKHAGRLAVASPRHVSNRRGA